jgi:hypothetical protein
MSPKCGGKALRAASFACHPGLHVWRWGTTEGDRCLCGLVLRQARTVHPTPSEEAYLAWKRGPGGAIFGQPAAFDAGWQAARGSVAR